MFGQGLSGEELAELIERDLGLRVAFPCFPLESPLGHTACCVVSKTWLTQLHNGTATHLPVIKGPGIDQNATTVNGNTQGEVNVFINVISKEKPLKQDNWTRARVFAQTHSKAASKTSQPTRKSFTTLTSVSTNSEWNVTAEAYVREILDIEEEKGIPKTEKKAAERNIECTSFRPIIESMESDEHGDVITESTTGPEVNNTKLIEHVLDVIYPTTRRYKVISSAGNNVGEPQTKLLALGKTAAEKEPLGVPRQAPANIASATVVIETESAHYCLSPHRSGGATGLTTLQDLLRFNPGNLNSSLKKGFLAYQLLKAVRALHANGIIHGGLHSSNIYIDENLWITLGGIKCSVPHRRIAPPAEEHPRALWRISQSLPKEIREEATVMKWAKGEISNFTYLMILNHAAGRRSGDPNVHPIFPWVTDFTGADVSHGWRDFSKTKFRLNKGDEQLDVTFDGPVPHHITDILSDITYYVYMARQIPIPVLCQFVRSKYEANEYPSSIRRLYEWTPDECIPEFYTDPSIFKSTHSDMPDMALPKWAKTPDDFIRIHRDALESEYVSQHLHQWIDLTFGYRLSGPGAIEAKNVALSLFPGQSDFMKHGVIQLFTDPHPQKLSNWSLSKVDFLKSQAAAQTSLEKASKNIKRRSFYRPQNDRPQFVEKVSDLLFRPTGPTRSKSVRQQPGSRPSSVVITAHERESSSAPQGIVSPSGSSVILSPTMSIGQDTGLAPASTRPEALVQFIQSEPIDLSRDIKETTFTEELEHFEKTFYFDSKYHFMNSEAALSRISADSLTPETGGYTSPYEESFEYMQSWDVYCLGELFKEIYLAEDIPNNGIAMALRPNVTVEELTNTRHIPISVSGTIIAMLKDDWRSRPRIDDILRKTIPALSSQSPNIAMFVPSLIAEIYEFLSLFYTCPESTQMELANKWIDRICGFEDETFEIALPVFVHLFTDEATRVGALTLLPKLGQRLGIKRTKTHLLKPILALFELVPHMYDTQLVTELKNGGTELIYRLIDPTPSKPTGRSESLSSPRLSVSRNALDFILQLSFSLGRHDWERHIAPILQKYFSGFGPDIDEVAAKPASAMELQRNEQMMYAYGQLCSCVGQEAMQSMIPASDAIERLIAARLASKEFGNSPLRSLGSITAQGKFVLTSSSSSTFWQQQRTQQARDLANSKKTAFSTKDLWSATSASMSKALSIFDSSKSKPAMGASYAQGNGQAALQSATSALTSASTSNSFSTIAGASVTSVGSTSSTLGGLAIAGKDGFGLYGYDRSINGSGSGEGSTYDSARSPTEAMSTGSMSPVLSSAPARKNRQTFGSPGKAKTAARLEQLRFLSTNQEEMAKSMQFAFNDWKLQGLEGHASVVRVIGANEYQRVLATGSKDRTVKLWSLDIHRTIENPDYADAGSGCLMTYNGHRRGAVYDLHFATGGGSFGTGDIVASCDGQIHLWEPETGRTLHQFMTGRTPVVTMEPIFRSRYIVAGLLDSTLSFLDSHTHANLHTWRSTSFLGVTTKVVTTNPSETLIATGFSNGTVTLLESRTGTLVGSWRASDNEITQMKFYTNDILITSAPADHMVSLWNVQTLTLIKSIRGTSEIVSMEIFKDEIITMHHNNSISFTPINDDSLAYTSKFKSSAIRSSISCISILPMNQLLVLGCMEGDLYLYS
ncbi:hypothetical protein BG005_011205 [Podila minutissima]|nr:hypothetical protein BG005_011205 [Podila minutissima]